MVDIETDTEDSDLEGILSNVARLVMRPPGASGKAKRGHLCFDSCFETGNLGRVDFIAEYEYDLFVRPDTCNPRFRFWFNFTVDNAKANQLAIFNVVNFHKTKNLFCEGLTPLVRSSSRPKWKRLPSESVYYYRSGEHRDHLILSFAFCFDIEEDVYQFALTYPYSYSRLQKFLLDMDAKRTACVRRCALAYSVLRRPCDLLTISSPFNLKPEVLDAGKAQVGAPSGSLSKNRSDFPRHDVIGKRTRDRCGHGINATEEVAKDDSEPIFFFQDAGIRSRPTSLPRVVVIIARVHGGECPTSFIVQGIIESLIGISPMATTLKDHVIFKIIPMINPDGVFLGNYRTSLMGADLNRMWGDSSPWGHPTLHALKNMILQLDKAKWCELDLVLDLHAHTSLLGTFVYGNSYDDVYRHERHIVFPKMLSHACEDYVPENTIYNKDPGKAQSARRWLCNNLRDNVNVYTIQTSIYGYRNAKRQLVTYTEEAYIRVGQNIVRAVLDYYQFLGVIPQADALPLHDMPKHPPEPPVPPPARAQKSSVVKVRQLSDRLSRPKTAVARTGGAPPTPRGPTPETETTTPPETDSSSESDTSGLVVRIVHHTTTSAEEDDEEVQNHAHSYSRFQLAPPSPLMNPANTLELRKTSKPPRRPATTFVRLFPEENSLKEDDTFSLPDLPSLRSSLPVLRRHQVPPPPRRKKLAWRQPLEVGAPCPPSYRVFDFQRMTRPRKRRTRIRRKRKSKSRSLSRSRPRVPKKPSKPAVPSAVPNQPSKSLKRIDVNELTIGGYRDSPGGWSANAGHRSKRSPSPPSLLQRFLDPRISLI